MSKYNLTKDDIDHLAKLSNLQLTSEESEKYTVQIDETIDYIENLNELDTTNVEPTNNGIKIQDVFFEDGMQSSRILPQEKTLQNAKLTKDKKYFIVKRIM